MAASEKLQGDSLEAAGPGPGESLSRTTRKALAKISDRPAPDKARFLLFNGFFASTLILLHVGFQILPSPFWFFGSTQHIFWRSILHTKTMFAQLLIYISQTFGPTKIILTSEGKDLDLSAIVKRDAKGKVIHLTLPERSIILANHQVYCDWSYIWNLLYFAELHNAIVIILKKSLKWIPIVGPAMQMFQFIFLSRSWDADQSVLKRQIGKMAAKAQESSEPLSLLIFPEGNLVSQLSRPISKKYADKSGIADMKHQILPRSTGLLFCLRALAKEVPSLSVIDITIGYEGIPEGDYGQDYYSLQSIFGAGQSPPAVHMHVRTFKASELPLGHDLTEADHATPEERKIFDDWVRSRWQEKDHLLGRFYAKGSFIEGKRGVSKVTEAYGPISIPIEAKTSKDTNILLGSCIPGAIMIAALTKYLIYGF
ncbi:uncharacterized protein L969DRAFT_14311 [Mixia osmundae IAM 14324]|uniref:Phospholipid/glycerol acyltransferase domain-containing protein n=1 Tax=Mixia osmundae (strain CBS 9802 / IAM 14324 / JCM 22182 / KY 12970) TaxID=764103 RepID=G7DZV3_MIXOS|nr:uncharacterized protein L969DRAFT_14311 [Mixia osmundae IAM 14324]KEI42106.1 hypothetical protein L969DRAFT_14311 [Mixia osmundae IAM 14324]GAA96113.1 hypothetical protein E5Q_02774 [Mixia osmundae IAM 14324]